MVPIKRIAFAAAVVGILAGGVALGINLSGGTTAAYEDRNLPEFADIDFADVERWRAEVGDDTEQVNPAVAWMWRNGDDLCNLAVSGINWRDIVRGLYAADRIESGEEIAWARGYVAGCENRAYLDKMEDR